MPCLLYLPSLTPEEESLPLLEAVYTALVELAKTRYPESSSGQRGRRLKLLDGVMRIEEVDDRSEQLEDVQHNVTKTISLLVAVLKDEVDVAVELQALAGEDPQLKKYLKVQSLPIL
ncbi:MAG: hypothetical protein Q9190_005890 [Brigantiaea leucoxantha]